MSSRWRRTVLQWAMYGIFLLLYLGGTAGGGETPQGKSSPRPSELKKKIHLQLRIASAKRRSDSLRYYRSIARQLKSGRIAAPPSRRKGINRPASCPPGIR